MTEMRVPLLDLKPQLNELHEEILSAVTRVVASTQYIMGPEIDALERELADRLRPPGLRDRWPPSRSPNRQPR